MPICKFCNLELKHLGSHERCCELNPDRDIFIQKLKKSSDIARTIKISEENRIHYYNELYKSIFSVNLEML